MASYNELNALIDAYINRNGVQAITGQILNGVLRAMVSQLGRGYTIMGAAIPATDPGTPDSPESWFAATPGIYTNFGGLEVGVAELAFLSYSPTADAWIKDTLTKGIDDVEVTLDNNVGTPSATSSYSDGVLTFAFHNLKGDTGPQGPQGVQGEQGPVGPQGIQGPQGDPGQPGQQGEPGAPGEAGQSAGFGAVSATVDANVGTPSVEVSASGPNTAKVFSFSFHNLKGDPGIQGPQGIQGETGATGATGPEGPQGIQGETGATGPQGPVGPAGVDTCFVTVDNTTGIPTCTVSLSNGVLTLAFSGLKGAQGNTGSSVDYPFTIVNNLTTDDATQALSAAMGVQLESEITQLEHEVHHLSGKYYGVFEMPSELPEGDVAGYAFVGETMPLALYNFDGEDWGDTGIAVSGITGPQGPQGIQGIQGIQGLPGVTSAVLTIDNETGIPYGEISVLNGVLSIALHNIKGLQGNSGYTGAAGELEVVNNTYQGGATSALSAEMGKQLEQGKVSGRVENQQDNDFAIADENDYDIVQFKNGDVKTKNFDSAKTPYSETTEDGADFEVNDANGFAILRCIGGHIKTKNFDSSTVGASPLAGKKVAFIGDSITAGYNASPTTKRFSTLFCELAGCTEKNLGVASTAIANNTLNGLGSSRFITRATSANLSNQDLVFVFGGTNDFSYDSKPIGDPFNIETITADTYIGDKKKTAPSDTDTFSGALHELILQIRSVAPSAQLVFITPLTRGRYNAGRPTSAECNQHGDFLQDFTDTIKTVCSFYSVPVVDLGVMMGQFWANDGNGTFGSYDDDGIHPNNAGHERIAKLLHKWVNNNLIF